VRRNRRTGDEGATLIETLVSLALVMTAMGAMGTYFVNSVLVVSSQRTSQTAAQVGNTAIEQIRALRGNSLAAGRGKDRVTQQWSAAPATVNDYLADMDPAYDGLAALTAGDDAPISTATQIVKSDGTNFARTIYVGECYVYTGLSADISNNCQPRALATDATLGKFISTARELQFYRAVVLISWPGRSCTNATCNYIVTTLVSRQAEPTFDVHQPPPVIQNGTVDLYQGVAASFPLTALFGQLPNTWSATNMPAGLSVTSTGVITGTPAVAALANKPLVTVADSLGRSDPEYVTINVWPKLTLTGLGTTTSHVGDAISQTAKATGGVNPGYVYSQAGFPSWLTLNSSDGTISGSPAAPGSYPVTVTVADANKTLDAPTTAFLSYTYTVYPAVTLAAIPDQQITFGSSLSVTAGGAGGDGTLTYSASGLPLGVSINSATGVISGTATVPGRYLPLVTVTDGSGGSASVRFLLAATATAGLLFTSPSPSAPDQASTVGNQVNVNLDNNGKALGLSPTLAVTGLPPGLSFNPASGKVNGKPTTAGTYVVSAVATNVLPPQVSVLTFLWTVS
jgi:type II secretory pathway pseudopilin PulG